jgi:large subunit ribosomal protein L24
MKLKRDQIVIVNSGDDKGKTGKIIKAFPKENKVLVEGVGAYKKHLKPTNGNEGGMITRFRPINASKVSLVETESKKEVKAVKEAKTVVKTKKTK